MDSESIQLFDSNNDEVIMPSIMTEKVQEEQAKLMSDSIDNAILGPNVKTLILPEDSQIAEYNYIFDFTKAEKISSIQKEALKALISSNGDTQLYLYKQQSGLLSIGFGDRYSLERVVPIIKQYVFDNEIPVYKNFKVGKPVTEVVSRDITKMRLKL